MRIMWVHGHTGKALVSEKNVPGGGRAEEWTLNQSSGMYVKEIRSLEIGWEWYADPDCQGS